MKPIEFIVRVKDAASRAFEKIRAAGENMAGSVSQSFKMIKAAAKGSGEDIGRSYGTLWRSVAAAVESAMTGSVDGALRSLSRVAPALAKVGAVVGVVSIALGKFKDALHDAFAQKHDAAMREISEGIAAIGDRARMSADEIARLRAEADRLHGARTDAITSKGRVEGLGFDSEESDIRERYARETSGVTDAKKIAELTERMEKELSDLRRRRIDSDIANKVSQNEADIDKARSEISALEKDRQRLKAERKAIERQIRQAEEERDRNSSAFTLWKQENGVGKAIDLVQTGGGFWGKTMREKAKDAEDANKRIEELQRKLSENIQARQMNNVRIESARDRMTRLSSRRGEIDAERKAKEDEIRRREEEAKSARATKDANDRESESERERADAAARAAQQEKERQREIDRLKKEIRDANVRKLKAEIRDAEAAEKEADARGRDAAERLKEARGRKLVTPQDESRDERRERKRREREDRSYENTKENIRRAYENARRFNPHASDEEILEKMPRKWREIVMQERDKNRDIKAAAAAKAKADKDKLDAQRARAAAEQKLEKRWGYVENIDKTIAGLQADLRRILVVDDQSGQKGG